jgi:hypothetical protein
VISRGWCEVSSGWWEFWAMFPFDQIVLGFTVKLWGFFPWHESLARRYWI